MPPPLSVGFGALSRNAHSTAALPLLGVRSETKMWFCQVVEAEMLIRQAGASSRFYPPVRPPALCPLFPPSLRIASPSLCGTPLWTADASWVGSVGQSGHTLTGTAGH